MRLNYSCVVNSNSVRDNKARRFNTVASAAVLVAGLAGCTGAPREDERINGWTMAPAILGPKSTNPRRTDQFGTDCRRHSSTRLSVGDITWFGGTFRSMTGIQVTNVTDENIGVNILVSVSAPLPAINILSVTFKIKDRTLPLNEVEALFNASCKPELVDYSEISREEADKISKALEGIRVVLGKLGIQQLGEFLFTINIPNGEYANATVVEERDNEIVLDINGQRVTLDRKINVNTEFVFEKAGYFSMPLRLEVDENGGLKAVVDCRPGSTATMEIFMSEHAALPMGATQFCPQPK